MPNRAFFFVDYEGFRQTRENVAFSTIPNMQQRQGILSVDVRDPRTGALYPAGTPIPMTPFAAQVLSDLPEPDARPRREQLRDPAAVPQPQRQVQRQVRRPDHAAAALLRAPRATATSTSSTSRRSRCPPAAAATASPTCRTCSSPPALTWAPSDNQLLEFRFGCSRTKAGKNPPALGTPGARGGLRHQRPAHRSARGRRPSRRSSYPRLHATSAARPRTRSGSTRPPSTRRSTTRAASAATRSRPASSSSTSAPKCRT